MTQNLVSNNLAAELLTKHRSRLEKEQAEYTRDKVEFLSELLRVEACLRAVEARIDECSKELERVRPSIYTTIGNTGFYSTGIMCPKQ